MDDDDIPARPNPLRSPTADAVGHALSLSGNLVRGFRRLIDETENTPDPYVSAFYSIVQKLEQALLALGDLLNQRQQRQRQRWRPPHALLPFEGEHHHCTVEIIHSCHGDLKALTAELPCLNGAGAGEYRHRTIGVVLALRANNVARQLVTQITSYTEVLQLSMMMISLGGVWAEEDGDGGSSGGQSDIREMAQHLSAALPNVREAASLVLQTEGPRSEASKVAARVLMAWVLAADRLTAAMTAGPVDMGDHDPEKAPLLSQAETETTTAPISTKLGLGAKQQLHSSPFDELSRFCNCEPSRAGTAHRLPTTRPSIAGQGTALSKGDHPHKTEASVTSPVAPDHAHAGTESTTACREDRHPRLQQHQPPNQNSPTSRRRKRSRSRSPSSSCTAEADENNTDNTLSDDAAANPAATHTALSLSNAFLWSKGKGFDVDTATFRFSTCSTSRGTSPLHLALREENVDLVRAMASACTSNSTSHSDDGDDGGLETRDRDGLTPLLLASSTRNSQTTQVLLDNGARIDVRDRSPAKLTPLHRCQTRDGGVKVAKLLVKAQQEAFDAFYSGSSSYTVATTTTARAQTILTASPTTLSPASTSSPFSTEKIHHSTVTARAPTATSTATATGTTNEQQPSRSLPPFDLLNATDAGGKTALFMAVENNNDKMAAFLLRSGADPDVVDNHGKTALYVACERGDEAMARRLLEPQPPLHRHAPPPSSHPSSHPSSQPLTITGGRTESVTETETTDGGDRSTKTRTRSRTHGTRTLGTQAGIQAGTRGRTGSTTAAAATNATPTPPGTNGGVGVEAGTGVATVGMDIHQIAIGAIGANPNIPGPGGCTPLLAALSNVTGTAAKLTIVRTLLRFGADPSVADANGWNAFHVAKRSAFSSQLTRMLQDAAAKTTTTAAAAVASAASSVVSPSHPHPHHPPHPHMHPPPQQSPAADRDGRVAKKSTMTDSSPWSVGTRKKSSSNWSSSPSPVSKQEDEKRQPEAVMKEKSSRWGTRR